MRNARHTLTATFVLMLGLLFAGAAAADDALLGAWRLTQVGEVEPADDQTATYTFRAETLTVSITVGDATQTWEVGYSVTDAGELSLESLPGAGLGVGESGPLVLTYSIDGDQLVMKRGTEGFGLTFARSTAE